MTAAGCSRCGRTATIEFLVGTRLLYACDPCWLLLLLIIELDHLEDVA